jgi:hypothetical protein
MANKIKPKRSYTANAVPTTSDLDANELAINWADGKAFTKNAAGNIVSVTLGGGGGGSGLTWSAVPASATATGTAGQIAYDAEFLYTCVTTNTWKRTALSTWATFTPSSITGLQLWLDASDSSTIFNASSGGSDVSPGGAIGRWQDKSGNGRHFVASGSAMPTFTSSGLNGRSVVTFNGTANNLTNSTNIIFFSSVTIIAVVRRVSGAYGGFITSQTGDDGPSLLIDNNKLFVRAGSGSAQTVATSANFTGPSVATAVINNWTPSLYVNGSLVGTGSFADVRGEASTTSIGTYRVGDTNFLNGYIAEMVVYNSVLSNANRSAVESYLMSKWAIT